MPFGDLLSDQGRVGSGAVVDDEIDPEPIFKIRDSYAMLHARCAMRLFLSCPIRPAYRSLAVPIRIFWGGSRKK
jgi:hypothetical protein